MSTALVFPGQGAEEPEMGLALARRDARAKHLLQLASEATHVDLLRAIERGGRALGRTEVLQPALVAVSLGAAHAMAEPPAAVLGHSLGELAAACFALDVDDETAIALAAERGRLMAEAAAARPGGMIARALAEAPPGLVLAAHNADDEHVFSGDEASLARVPGATRLRVAGAWHSPAMHPAVAPFRASLDRALGGRALRVPLLSAVTASPVEAPLVPERLASGLVSPVRWVESLRALPALGVQRLVCAPPGRLSRALARRALGPRFEVTVLGP